ncbi:unnamed protein product [Prunus armeniaca]
MERGALRPRGDLTTAFSDCVFCGLRPRPSKLRSRGRGDSAFATFLLLLGGKMLDETVGTRAEGKSLQSVHDRVLLGTNIAPTSLDSSVAARAEVERIPRDGPFAFPLK